MAARARFNLLYEERAEPVLLLRLGNSIPLAIEDADNDFVLNDHNFPSVLLDHLLVMIDVVPEVGFEGTVHIAILGSHRKGRNVALPAYGIAFVIRKRPGSRFPKPTIPAMGMG